MKENLITLKVSSSMVVRANRLRQTNTNKDSDPCPIEVKLTSTNDKKLILSELSLLKGSGVFVKPKFMWIDRQNEKTLLSFRFALINLGIKRDLFRLRDPKLFYDGKQLLENISVDDKIVSFKLNPTSSVKN